MSRQKKKKKQLEKQYKYKDTGQTTKYQQKQIENRKINKKLRYWK